MRDALELLTTLQRLYPTTNGRHHSLTLHDERLELCVWLEDVPPAAGSTDCERYVRTLTNDDIRRSPEYISDEIAAHVLTMLHPGGVKATS